MFFNFSALLSKQKLFRMLTGCQNDMPKDRLTDRQTDRQTKDKTTFQPSYQNKNCSECQQDVKASVRLEERYTEPWADRVTE